MVIKCSPCFMPQDFRERGRWLARNVLPHEPLIRAKLRDMCLYDLDIEDVIQEMYAKISRHFRLWNRSDILGSMRFLRPERS